MEAPDIGRLGEEIVAENLRAIGLEMIFTDRVLTLKL